MWVKLKQLIWQWRGVLIASPSVGVLLIGLRLAGLLQPLELAAWDQFFRLRSSEAVDSRITIVEMNESDIQKLGYPLSDEKLAKLLSIIKQHQPSVIGLDIYRDLPVEPGFKQLEEIFASTPNLFGIQKMTGSASTFVNPPPKLKELGQVGASDIVIDQDGKVRRNLLSIDSEDGETILGLGTQVAVSYLETKDIYPEFVGEEAEKLKLGKGILVELDKSDGGYVGNDIGGYQILANFRNLRSEFPTISMSQVLAGKMPPEFVRDRIVLIGPTAASLDDFFYTPYRKRVSGVTLHGDIASQLISMALEGRPQIQIWSDTYEHLWIFTWSFIGAIFSWKQRYRKQTVSTYSATFLILLFAIGLVGGSYLAFLVGAWWIPVIPGLLSLFGSAITVTAIVARDTSTMRQTFGRYLTDEVVASLLETPEGLKIGGEKKNVTILVSDLRGFSAMSEQVSPEKVVEIINLYLAEMTDIINNYKGTINDFMGDGIFVMFGAPVSFADNAQRAVTCAVAMQLAMDGINQKLAQMKLPPLEMGIGIHCGEVLAGSIGSKARAKYTVMGSNVNLAARIETYTVGGQILVSQETVDTVGEIIQLSGEMQVQPKGFTEPISIFEVGGIGGQYNLFLPSEKDSLMVLEKKIPVKYRISEGKHISESEFEGYFVKLSLESAELITKNSLKVFSNLQIQLAVENEQLNQQHLYGKIIKILDENQNYFRLRFTALPTEIKAWFEELCEKQ
ncbi:putative transmembrane sensor domain protein [Rivularia sp. PCC 7116]|uniref:CHASE2 domain-containing protein n=1 Tax=Rivularia sp. PCC 7116 TaxID=373994 RepID=UPI00029ECEC7|nr:CHASE2 domain-containing protein [Rivularia sp. PCC 7116]AFY58507.1 putative transmembrane sensor domain protein [Rivularia sp. PCC 7116]